jgi:hypothetical protein
MKTETGVMVIKDGMGWGTVRGEGTYQGWMNVEEATISDPKYCKQPTDLTYKNSPYESELGTGSLVVVERTTEVKFL